MDGRLTLLAQSARQIEELAGGTTVDQDFIDDAARTADATRAVYLQPITAGGTTTLLALADSPADVVVPGRLERPGRAAGGRGR